MCEGQRRKIEVEKSKLIESWRQTRLIAFLIIQDRLKDKNISMFDFYPLPGDPTAEDIKRDYQKSIEQDSEWQKSVIEKLREKRKK